VLIDGHDTDGNLVLADNQLAAVFVCLDGTHHDPEHKQRWRLEAGAWVEQILMRKAYNFAEGRLWNRGLHLG
jgi:hypothetical protein